jgi:hypothetical protein
MLFSFQMYYTYIAHQKRFKNAEKQKSYILKGTPLRRDEEAWPCRSKKYISPQP